MCHLRHNHQANFYSFKTVAGKQLIVQDSGRRRRGKTLAKSPPMSLGLCFAKPQVSPAGNRQNCFSATPPTGILDTLSFIATVVYRPWGISTLFFVFRAIGAYTHFSVFIPERYFTLSIIIPEGITAVLSLRDFYTIISASS